MLWGAHYQLKNKSLGNFKVALKLGTFSPFGAPSGEIGRVGVTYTQIIFKINF